MASLILLVVIGTSIWVAIDASNLGAPRDRNLGVAGSSPIAWLLACLLFWIVFFPLYLAKRGKIRAAGQDYRSGGTQASSGPVQGEKVCPRCAENIKAAATVCRYCGTEQEAAAPEKPAEPLGRIFSDESRQSPSEPRR